MTQAITTQEPEENPAAESKELIPFDEINAVTIFIGGGMPALVNKIIERINSVIVDPTNVDDQAVMRSMDKQINKVIKFIDDMRLDLVKSKKQELSKIDTINRDARTEIRKEQHDFIQPLRDIEAIETARKAKIEARWNELLSITDWEQEITSGDIQNRIDLARELANAEDWGKYSVKIINTKLDIMQTLTKKLLAQKTLEELRIEEAHQKEEEEARKVKEREEQIRKDATEKAEKDAADKIKKDQEEKDKRDNLKAEEAKRTIMAPAQPKPRPYRGTPSSRPVVIKKPEVSEAEKRRIADEKHKEKIHTEIAAALQDKVGYTESLLAVAAIVEGKIPHIKIVY